MESYAKLPPADVDRLVDFVYSLRSPDAKSPEDFGVGPLWDEHECGQCHETAEKYGLDGPSLFRYGSEEWVTDVVKNAGADFLYDKMNTMPAFETRMAPEDLAAVVAFMMTVEKRAEPTAWPFVNDPGVVPTPRTSTDTPAKGKKAPRDADEKAVEPE
jgi:hypothetical protein